MPQDICVDQRAPDRVSGVPTGFIMTLVILAIAALVVTDPSPDTAVAPAGSTGVALEDWHGNVMRSR
ncbi:hypothetical protein SAMN04487859_11416 [Roseovarius lutimaris]|uniref:Uncharacterized protein n=1 Tax=Roseovarius lutimaris TaxID=1005928 RepID=A0A1I5DZJ7_9RHOB|nr:hypothetical protein [Roseovarius lutimaris]SFO04500.1 hypothetical protein SAMN04487859_11416 [Roseovarius lutimaris]